jgi:hypothetical protein
MGRLLFTLAVIVSAGSLFSQDIQVNRQNKTVAITADESVTADAEIAGLEIGYHNFGSTKDAAFQENVRVADRITKRSWEPRFHEQISKPTNCDWHARTWTKNGPPR